ncbi:phosphatase 2C-like domain-containing protein [Microdochium bolleyi]|uniref:Phosphatase 2C-like domain-containing protein n=1 Tax=Microdochium bolleyi TaxID=196109 RepID=A0A136IXL3_9PEZI|nr:phosphatase 2C-like domain-containing protein [Microdochium bolleyi]
MEVLLSLSGMLKPAHNTDSAPGAPAEAVPHGTTDEPEIVDYSDDFVPGQRLHTVRTLMIGSADAGGENPTHKSSTDGKNVTPQRAQHTLARVHVLQLQPTDRPIEDRFSVRLTQSSSAASATAAPTSDGGGSDPSLASTAKSRTRTRIRLQLGVYDGHRGPWAAQYVASTLPERLDGVELVPNARMVGEDEDEGSGAPRAEDIEDRVRSAFRALDDEILEGFTKVSEANLSEAKDRQHRRHFLGLLGLGEKKEPSEAAQHKPKAEDRLLGLRAVSGCTASLLLLDWYFDHPETTSQPATAASFIPGSTTAHNACCLINLGDSRTVVAELHHPETSGDTCTLRQTSDVNSSVPSERESILRQHPLDDPRDVVVGGRLFGETLSTRAFGDAHYKLPVRRAGIAGDAGTRRSGHEKDLSKRQQQQQGRLSAREKALHRHHVQQMSACLAAEASEKATVRDARRSSDSRAPRRARILTLGERYEAMFSAYRTPPYVSAVPDVQVWSEELASAATSAAAARNTADRVLEDTNSKRRMLGILATDGLWDLVSSDEALSFLRGAVAGQQEVNLAEALLEYVVEEKGAKPGDDVTILVVEYDASGCLEIQG